MVRSGGASGADQSLAAPARTLGGGGRSQGGNRQSLQQENRSQRCWAVTRKDAADVQDPRSVTPHLATALRSSLLQKPLDRQLPKPFRFTAAGAAAGTRLSWSAAVVHRVRISHSRRRLGRCAAVGGRLEGAGSRWKRKSGHTGAGRSLGSTQRTFRSRARSLRATQRRFGPDPTATNRPSVTQAPLVYGCRSSRGNEAGSWTAAAVHRVRIGHSRRRLGRSAAVGGR